MKVKQLKLALAERDTAAIRREIAWLKRHIKVRESVLSIFWCPMLMEIFFNSDQMKFLSLSLSLSLSS
jgi:hypothetical protein